MQFTEEQFADILDEVIAETLDLKRQEKVRFCNALLERLLEEDFFLDEDEDGNVTDEQADEEED